MPFIKYRLWPDGSQWTTSTAVQTGAIIEGVVGIVWHSNPRSLYGQKWTSRCWMSTPIALSAHGMLIQPFKQPKDWSRISSPGKEFQKHRTFLEKSFSSLVWSCSGLGQRMQLSIEDPFLVVSYGG